MTDKGWRCLVARARHDRSRTRFAAITAVANPPRCPEPNCRPVAKAGVRSLLRCIGVMSSAQEGGIGEPSIPPFVLLARILPTQTKTIFVGTFT
jgi:hypothetical protein